MRRTLVFVAVLSGWTFVFASPPLQAEERLRISSVAFEPDTPIPDSFTCRGADQSPALSWQGVPPTTRSLALIVDDPDAPGGTFVHWVVYNLDAAASGLAQGQPRAGSTAGGGIQGRNDFGGLGYRGPCPPPGLPHHYHFRLMALDSALVLPPGASVREVEEAARGHILATTELVGTFQR